MFEFFRPAQDSRIFFAKLQIICASSFVAGHLIAVCLGLWKPLPGILPKISLYFNLPLLILSSYLVFLKKIFPAKIGDVIHSCVLIFLISVFSICYGGGIGGVFVFLFFLLIAFSILFRDEFVPLFIGGTVSFLVVGEFFLTTDFAHPSYIPLFKAILQVMAFLMVGYLSSSFIKRILIEQKMRRELSEAYQELKKLDKAKSEFLSIASHQLRTPLTAIKGYISMILEGTYGRLSKEIKRPMENIYKSSERLIKLVNDLLNVSRIEAGRMELNLEPISIEEIISSVTDELGIRVRDKGIYLKWKKPKFSLPKILADREKIRQVILNVIDNAIRYTNKGGITIRVESQNSKLKIITSDTGEGMTKEEIDHLFESFSRGRAGVRFWVGGIGLGLYVSKKFVEMHNGEIWAESKGKGKGSIFYIELPIK